VQMVIGLNPSKIRTLFLLLTTVNMLETAVATVVLFFQGGEESGNNLLFKYRYCLLNLSGIPQSF
jgi:hypothetical protein